MMYESNFIQIGFVLARRKNAFSHETMSQNQEKIIYYHTLLLELYYSNELKYISMF